MCVEQRLSLRNVYEFYLSSSWLTNIFQFFVFFVCVIAIVCCFLWQPLNFFPAYYCVSCLFFLRTLLTLTLFNASNSMNFPSKMRYFFMLIFMHWEILEISMKLRHQNRTKIQQNKTKRRFHSCHIMLTYSFDSNEKQFIPSICHLSQLMEHFFLEKIKNTTQTLYHHYAILVSLYTDM